MSDARTHILAAIRAATADVPPGEPTTARSVRAAAAAPADLALLAERIADYQATVTRVGQREAVADAVAAILARHDATRIAIDPQLPADLHPGRHADLVHDDPPLDHDTLSGVDGALTTATLAIAQTGTLILDHGPGQGRRALTLLPDLHVCVITAAQVRQTVADAVTELAHTTRPITFVSGPSATSDIELERVEGVHGHRRLEVVLVG